LRSTIQATLIALMFMFSGMAYADCFDEAAAYQHVNPTILRGIRIVENAEGNPYAVGRNKNGSVDLGMMQINSIHLPELKKFKIHRRDLMNSCKNIYVAAWLLRRQMDRHGNNWVAVGGYHSNTPALRAQYAAKVQKAVKTILAAKQQQQMLASKKVNPYLAVMASN
jgi:lysozyme-related protein Hpa2